MNFKITALAIAATATFACTQNANAGIDISVVIENSGNTWTYGDNYIGLIGFDNTAPGQTVTLADILAEVTNGTAGQILNVYNGVDNLGGDLNLGGGTIADYESTIYFPTQMDFLTGDNLPYSNNIDLFTGVDLVDGLGGDNDRFVSVVFIEFTGDSNIVFSGTATLSANGNLGEFPAPIPGPGALALMGIAGLAGTRRRRRTA